MRKKPARKYTPPPPSDDDFEEDYEDEDDWEEDEEIEHDDDAEYYGYPCDCASCVMERAAEKDRKKAKPKTVKIVGRVARARNFVDTTLAKLDDWIGEEKYSECNIVNNVMNFSNPRRYFVHVQHERRGCFGGEGKFMNKSDIIKMIQNQLEPLDYREIEDRIVIFDVDRNKVVKPKIIL
jgi:hypothetical protein